MKKLVGRLATHASMLPLAFAFAAAAAAQTVDQAAPEEEEIVVTGSSLRGVTPVGSNLTTVDREELETIAAQNVQQILKTVPAVVGLQSPGQGQFGSFDGAGTNAPTIHGLGASASNSTLILLNGHRMPVSGVNHVLADPNILAPLALQRVEVLADGASSVYGSDAVAGVVNFITRRDVDGVEVTAQRGFGDSYDTANAGFIAGKHWDTGSAAFSYNFSDRSALRAADREYAAADHRPLGGTNFGNFACAPASILVGSTVYFAPYTGAGVANNATANGVCDFHDRFDLLPAETRNSVFFTMQQELSDRLSLTTDVIYSLRENHQNISRGTASGTIYGPGSTPPAGRSINPFFVAPSAAPATNTETVNFSADDLLGPGAYIDGTAETFYARGDLEYALNDAWTLNAGVVIGRDEARLNTVGALCGSCFNLALNGFTSTTLNGVTQSVSQALTTANALNPFGSGTAAATIARLSDSNSLTVGHQTIANYYGKIDGELFAAPGGAVRFAFGGEYTKYTLDQDVTRPTGLGPATTASAFLQLVYERDVSAVFAELFVPLIGPEQNIPLIRRFDLNLSGRYDEYSDFGETTNPKVAANWEMFEGFKLRGNWSTSFVAPALTSRGSNEFGVTAESLFGNASPQLAPFNVPYVNFPSAASVPGCPAAPATTCTFNNSAIPGVVIAGGNGNLKPQEGEAWSIGADYEPEFIPGLRVSVTYWNNELRGGITAPQPALALGAADLSGLLQIFPAGATAAQIAAATQGLPQTSPLPTPAYFIYNFQQNNVLNLDVAGIDVAVNYTFATEIGDFTINAAATQKTKFDQFFGASGQIFSALGTASFNTTFPSIETEGRLNVGWDYEALSANVFVNYVSSYRNWGGQTQVPITRTNGFPTGGGDEIDSNTTVDLNLAYTLDELLMLKETQLFLDVTNLFDQDPPFYNTYSLNNVNGTGVGYDGINASPLGRVITVGFRTGF